MSISGPEAVDIQLGSLATVSTLQLSAAGAAPASVSLPSLATAVGLAVTNVEVVAPMLAALTTLTIPSGSAQLDALTTVGSVGCGQGSGQPAQAVLPTLTTVTGGFSGNRCTNLQAPLLGSIGGTINWIRSTATLPALATITDQAFIDSSTLALPALTSVGTRLTLSGTAAVNAPALLNLPGLTLRGSADFTATDLHVVDLRIDQHTGPVSLEGITRAGSAFFSNMTTLVDIGLPDLAAVDFLSIPGGTAARSIDLSSLTTIPSNANLVFQSLMNLESLDLRGFTAGDLTLQNNAALTSLRLDAFASGDLTIDNNDGLTSLALPSYVPGTLNILRNDRLPQCSIDALCALAGSSCSGNDDAAICP